MTILWILKNGNATLLHEIKDKRGIRLTTYPEKSDVSTYNENLKRI